MKDKNIKYHMIFSPNKLKKFGFCKDSARESCFVMVIFDKELQYIIDNYLPYIEDDGEIREHNHQNAAECKWLKMKKYTIADLQKLEILKEIK